MSLQKLTLDEVFSFHNGKAPNTIENGIFPVFGSNGRIGLSNDFNHENSIIIGRVGAYCGSIEVCESKYWASDNTIIVKPKDGQNLFYWYYKLKYFPLRSFAGGAAQPLLTQSSLKPIQIKCHTSELEQQKIALILKSYDNLIENNRRRIQLLEESARLLYREWFVFLRFPGHEHVKVVEGVPEGWEDTFFPDIIEINPKTTTEKNKEICYVPMSALSESGMVANKSDFERRTSHTSVKFKKDDVLLARITPCLENGKTGFVYFLEQDEVACGSTEFIVLRGNKVSSYFTYCLARSYDFREFAIKSMIGSSGRQRVQTSCFSKFRCSLPPKYLLQQFDEVAVKTFEQISVLMKQIERLEKARDLLLPRLMNGEITV